MADRSQTPAMAGNPSQPSAAELVEIMAELEFFLEMDEATALEAEDEVVIPDSEAGGQGKGGGDVGK